MQYRFYIATGEPVRKLLSEMRAIGNHASIYRDFLIGDTGASNLFYYAGEPGRPRGLVFAERKDRPGLKFGANVGEGFTYFPETATEEGKKLAKALDDPRVRFDPEAWLLEKLKIEGHAPGYCEHCRNIHAKYRPRIYLNPSQSTALYLKIPGEMAPYPELPDWFRETRESVWLAEQGK